MNLRFIRKALATVSAISIALTAVIIPSAPVVSAEGEWYAPYVDALFDLGIVDSTGNAFNPGDNLTRAALSAMLNRASGFAVDATEVDDPGFSDVSESDWFYVDVAALENAGVVQGTTPTTFSPGAYVTRAAAAKMISLALDVSTSDEDVPFADVGTSDWFESYVGSLYWNSIVDGVAGSDNFSPAGLVSRAAMAKMLALAIAVSEGDEDEYARGDESAFAGYSASEVRDIITGGVVDVVDDSDDSDDTDTASSVAFSVGLASNSPMTATIPLNGYSVPYTYLTFTAGPEEGVNVTSLVLTRNGLGSTSDFTRVKLYEGLTQLSSAKTLSSQYNSANFNLASSPVAVSAGSSKTVRVLADMAGAATGVSNQLGVASANDVVALGAETGGAVTVGGSFPLYGNLMTTSGVNVGNIDVELTDPNGTGEFYIGDQDGVFTRITLASNGEDTDLTSITFRNSGSAGDDEVANLSLYNRGQLVAGPAQMVNRYVTLEFTEPLYLEKGSSTTMELRGDIVGGYAKTVGFSVYKAWHINAVGRVYGFPVEINDPSGTITLDNITGSRLSFATGSKNPTVGDVKPNAKDFVGLQFNIINTGDVVDIQNLVANVVTTAGGGTITPAHVSDVKIWRLDDDFEFVNVVAGPVEPSCALSATVGADCLDATGLTFSDVFEVEANTTAHFAITYDLANTVTAGDDVTISLSDTKGDLEIRNVVTGDTIYNGTADTTLSTYLSTAIGGNTRTAASPGLTFSVANAPSTDAFVKNSINVPVVAFNAKAGSADDVTLTSATFTLSSGTGSPKTSYTCSGTAASDDIRAVKLYADVDGTETLLDGPREVSSLSVNFTGFQQEIPAGETVRLLIRADIPSSADTNICPTFSIAPVTPATGTTTTAMTANDSDGRSIVTASKIVPAGGANTTPTAYVLAALSGKIQVVVSNDTPNAGQVIAGAEDVPVAKFKFEASTVEDVEIHKLRLYNAESGTDDAIQRVKLWDGDTLVASGTVASQYITWENLAITIPRNSSKTLDLTVTFNSSNTIVDIAGKAPRFVIYNLEDNWSDGAAAIAPDGTMDATGGDMKAVGKQSGQLLVNVAATTDAIAGDRGFYTVAKGNYCDSVGFETGAATCDSAVSFSGNTLTKAQYVYNTKVTLSLEGGSGGTPVGAQGAASGDGVEITLFKFRVAAAANSTAANPREIVLNDLYLTVSGDAEADNFKLYGPSSSSTAMTGGTSDVKHRTNGAADTGATTTSHTTRTTVIPFTGLTGTDSKIAYGSSKVYTLKGYAYAKTDNASPLRSLRVFIDNYGTSAGASDLVWFDNGTTTANSNSQAVYWVHEENVDQLRPSSPMSFSGSSYIVAGTTAPVLDSVRATAATTLMAYFTLPIDSGTVSTAPNTQFDLDALGTDTGVGVADVSAQTAVVSGNAITITDAGGTTFAMTTASWDATPPFLDIDSDVSAGAPITDDLEAIGSGASGANTPCVDTNDNVVLQNF